jgi:hypothetical protein
MAHEKIVGDWLRGWNTKDLEAATIHFTDDAVFSSPSVLALGLDPSGRIRGKAAICALTAAAFERFPQLRFEIDTVLEHADRILILYRKLNVFSADPGLTMEIFDLEGERIRKSTVYWGVEEVAAGFPVHRAH